MDPVLVSNNKMHEKQTSSSLLPGRRIRRCLACGTEEIKPGKRYCSKQCRQKLMWALSLSKGLLQTLNTRYAIFSFTEHYVSLDVMPTWSNGISRFVYERKSGYPPANALKELVLEAGKEWYEKRSRRISRSFASQSILEEKVEHGINPDSIKPNANRIPRLSTDQKKALKHLNISMDRLVFGDYVREIKKAYREMAKVCHPDKGGDGERFKEINSAHESMLQWVQNPSFRSNNALPGCWSYNGYKNRWSPPLWH
jgi:hypothetical protein